MCGLFLEQNKGIKGPKPKVLKLKISKKRQGTVRASNNEIPCRNVHACWCHVVVSPSPQPFCQHEQVNQSCLVCHANQLGRQTFIRISQSNAHLTSLTYAAYSLPIRGGPGHTGHRTCLSQDTPPGHTQDTQDTLRTPQDTLRTHLGHTGHACPGTSMSPRHVSYPPSGTQLIKCSITSLLH